MILTTLIHNEDIGESLSHGGASSYHYDSNGVANDAKHSDNHVQVPYGAGVLAQVKIYLRGQSCTVHTQRVHLICGERDRVSFHYADKDVNV